MNPNGYRSAFPTTEGQAEGLTKRELFAAMAMQGILAADHDNTTTQDQCMSWAIGHADALISALNETEAG